MEINKLSSDLNERDKLKSTQKSEKLLLQAQLKIDKNKENEDSEDNKMETFEYLVQKRSESLNSMCGLSEFFQFCFETSSNMSKRYIMQHYRIADVHEYDE